MSGNLRELGICLETYLAEDLKRKAHVSQHYCTLVEKVEYIMKSLQELLSLVFKDVGFVICLS